MLDGYNRTTNMVFKVLKDPRMKRLTFGVSVYKFEPHHYARLAFELARGTVETRFDSAEVETAGYNPLNDTMYFGFKALRTIEHKAAVVHECTHAVCDMRGLKLMDQTASEMAAYIAQYMFIGANMFRHEREAVRFTPGGDFNIGSIANAAWRIAHSNLCQTDPYKPSPARGYGTNADYADLAEAIMKSKLYAKKAEDLVGYNGV